MSAITTHVLDAVLGSPATNVAILLAKHRNDAWVSIGASSTDSDGRCRDLCPDASAGMYRLTFLVGAYFEERGRISIYPEIVVSVHIDGEHHYHIPLLLSDNSYTTYRGS